MELGLFLLHVVPGLLLMGHGAQKLFGLFGGHGPAGHRPVHGLAGHAPRQAHGARGGRERVRRRPAAGARPADPAGRGHDRLHDARGGAHGAPRQGALGHRRRLRSCLCSTASSRSPWRSTARASGPSTTRWAGERSSPASAGASESSRSRRSAPSPSWRLPGTPNAATASRPPANRSRPARRRAPVTGRLFVLRRLALLEDGVPLGQQRLPVEARDRDPDLLHLL